MSKDMQKDMQKDSKKSDLKSEFFTETVISFPISLNEHKVKLAIHGIFKLQNDKLVPVPIQISIVQVKNKNKIVSSSKKISNFIKSWISNNPDRLNEILTSELGMMLNIRPVRKKSISVDNNPVDKQ